MENVRDSIIQCLYNHADDDNKLIQELTQIVETEGKSTYSSIFHILTQLELEPDIAEGYWLDVIAHKNYLSEKIGRNVKLRTAICDFFCSINKNLTNPVMVEIYIFEAQSNTAKYDHLTGLFNRHYFDEAFQREISRAGRHLHDLSLIFLDLDYFKKINDTYGHLAGDLTLKSIAGVIKKQLRTEDIAARYGGEEIVMLLPETSKAKAYLVGERIRKKVAETTIRYGQDNINVTVSGGLASFPIDAEDSTALINYADLALYQAKQKGRNMLNFHSFEKRRFIRINFSAGVTMRKIGISDIQDISGSLKNMSLNGILIETETPIDINSLIQLCIPIKQLQSSITIMGTVVRVEIFSPNRYEIGISFTDMDELTQQELSKIIMETEENSNFMNLCTLDNKN